MMVVEMVMEDEVRKLKCSGCGKWMSEEEWYSLGWCWECEVKSVIEEEKGGE